FRRSRGLPFRRLEHAPGAKAGTGIGPVAGPVALLWTSSGGGSGRGSKPWSVRGDPPVDREGWSAGRSAANPDELCGNARRRTRHVAVRGGCRPERRERRFHLGGIRRRL